MFFLLHAIAMGGWNPFLQKRSTSEWNPYLQKRVRSFDENIVEKIDASLLQTPELSRYTVQPLDSSEV